MSETTFTDAENRDWHLTVTVGDSIRLKRELGFNIGKLLEEGSGEFRKLIQDEWLIVQILAVLLGPQLQSRKMLTESGDGDGSKKPTDSFYDGLVGETLDDAIAAFLHAVADSLPKSKRRAMKAMLKKLSGTIETAATAMDRKIESMDLTEKITTTINQIEI